MEAFRVRASTASFGVGRLARPPGLTVWKKASYSCSRAQEVPHFRTADRFASTSVQLRRHFRFVLRLYIVRIHRPRKTRSPRRLL